MTIIGAFGVLFASWSETVECLEGIGLGLEESEAIRIRSHEPRPTSAAATLYSRRTQMSGCRKVTIPLRSKMVHQRWG